MSTNLISSGTTARQKVNLRTPDVMAAVQQQVESHYRSDIYRKGPARRWNDFRRRYDSASLAKQFGFCYGSVEGAIDLATPRARFSRIAACSFLVAEIIHNPAG